MKNVLRQILEPDLVPVREHYAHVKQKILDYTDYVDEHGDENNEKYRVLEQELHLLTQKDMSQFNLWEWWEADGVENLAFRICLPDPPKVDDFSREELREVVERICTFVEPTPEIEQDEIAWLLWGNQSDFYHQLLKLNFATYDFKYFIRNKDKSGDYFEYSIEQKIEAIWNQNNH